MLRLRDAFITGTGAFLPGEPVANDRMEDFIGRIGGRTSSPTSRCRRGRPRRRRSYWCPWCSDTCLIGLTRFFGYFPLSQQIDNTVRLSITQPLKQGFFVFGGSQPKKFINQSLMRVTQAPMIAPLALAIEGTAPAGAPNLRQVGFARGKPHFSH
jgi:hypothetical protein